jgi:nuclear transport factor 2 (NTF2) superfamily protein
MGIAFGSCHSCTPQEYRTAIAAVSEIHRKAEEMWKQKDAEKAARRAEKKRKWIEKQEALLGIGAVKSTLHEIEMKHHRSYRYLHEQAVRKEKETIV